ncbi:MAG: hypothetical protein ACR2GH_07095 [Pseudonocardia sp.]
MRQWTMPSRRACRTISASRAALIARTVPVVVEVAHLDLTTDDPARPRARRTTAATSTPTTATWSTATTRHA